MKTRNLIGKIFCFIISIVLIVMVFYPQILEYFYLTDRPTRDFHLLGKDGVILGIAFVFMWGGAKFVKISDFLIDKLFTSNKKV